MAKTTNYKNKEPLEVQAKRCLLNGMTMTDVEKYLSITRDKVRMINGQITPEDKKTLIGKGLQDCVPEGMQQQIAELLKKGRTTKAISQVFKLPVRVINAVGETRIERVLETIKTKEEIPLVVETSTIVPEIDISDNGSIIESAVVEPPKRRGRKSTVDMEMCELLYNEQLSGKTYSAIAKEYGLTQSTVGYYISRYRKANDIKTVRRVNVGKYTHQRDGNSALASLTNDIVRQIAELITKGLSNSEISDITGVEKYKIADIRGKKTYRSITKNYIFPVADIDFHYFASRGVSRETLNKIIEMLMEKKTDMEIAKAVNVSKPIVNNIRHKKTYKRFTRNMEFPEPDAISFNAVKSENARETTHNDSDENTHNKNTPIVTETVPIDNGFDSTVENINDATVSTEIGTHKYFANIAKAFASDKFSAILVKCGNMLVYGVENSVKAALLRVISLATPDEISGCDIYIAGEDVIDEEIINSVKTLGVETIIATK